MVREVLGMYGGIQGDGGGTWGRDISWNSNTERDLNIQNGAGFIWLRTGTSCRLLLARQRTFGYYEMWGISWLAEKLLVYSPGFCSMQFACLLLTRWNFWHICITVHSTSEPPPQCHHKVHTENDLYFCSRVGSRFRTGLCSRMFGRKSNRGKRSTIYIV